MQGILTSSSPGESKLRRRRRGPVYLLRAVWFGVAVLVVELMLPAIRPTGSRNLRNWRSVSSMSSTCSIKGQWQNRSASRNEKIGDRK